MRDATPDDDQVTIRRRVLAQKVAYAEPKLHQQRRQRELQPTAKSSATARAAITAPVAIHYTSSNTNSSSTSRRATQNVPVAVHYTSCNTNSSSTSRRPWRSVASEHAVRPAIQPKLCLSFFYASPSPTNLPTWSPCKAPKMYQLLDL